MPSPRLCAFLASFAFGAMLHAQTATLSLGSGSGAPNSVVPLNLTLGGGALPAGVQFSLNYPAAALSVESSVIGSAASSKSINCSPDLNTAGKTNCLIVGINADAIPNGQIATISFRVAAATAATSANITMSGVSATSPAATNVNATGSGNTITINQPTPVNHAPTANNASTSTNEDTAKLITLTGSDSDGDSLTFSIVSQPGKGSLSGSGANRTYTPSANVNGADSFTFQVNDGHGGTGNGVISITINAVNDAPTAQNQSVSTAENTAKAITLGGSDIDSNNLTFSIVGQPSHGSVSGGTSAGRTYTPANGYSGPDSFTFRVSDGSLTADGTVNITVTAAANNPPSATNGSTSTNEDTAKSLTLLGSDPDGDPITFSILSQPSHGSVSGGTGSGRIYTPTSNYSGPDSFTFRVTDSANATANATFSITVNAVNDAPTAQNQSVSTAQNTAKAITLGGSDIDSNNLAFSIIGQPSHGSVSGGSSAGRTYTPANGYSGPDSFTFRVSDGSLTADGTVSITVTAAANNPPSATNGSTSTNEDTAKSLTLLGSDPDGDPITFSIVSQPSHGSVSGGTGSGRIYTPTSNYSGPDSFTFRVTDSANATANATFSITVNAVNDAPTAQNQSVSTAQNTAKAITLGGSDIDSNNLTFSIIGQPSHGSVSGGSSAGRTYTPANGYSGPDSFTFRVSDGSLTADGTVSINVAAGASNDPPTVTDENVTTNEDTPKQITLQATDPDGDSLTFQMMSAPSKGSLAGGGATRMYTPNPDVNGPDAFTFRVDDGKGGSATGTVNIMITPVNDAPKAQNQSVSTQKNKQLPVTLSGTDVDGDALTFSLLSSPSHGAVSGTAPSVMYVPANGYSGSDSFRFRVRDPQGSTADGTINITVGGGGGQNSPPGPHNQHVNTTKNKAAAITLTASDSDGDSLTFSIASSPAHGSLTGSAPNVTYQPANGYVGDDGFTFKVDDGTASANGTVSITVNETDDPNANKAPTAADESVSTNQDSPKLITLKGSDLDGDALTFSVTGNPAHGSLSGTPPNLTYNPNSGYSGADSITFQVSDGKGGTDSGKITIAVVGSNAVGLSSVTCSGSTLTGGGSRTCQVALTDRAPSGGLSINLSCSSKQVIVPDSVRVSSRSTLARFKIFSPLIENEETAQLTASLGSAPTLDAGVALAVGTVTTQLELVPLQPTDLSCTPVQVKAGTAFTCRATLNSSSFSRNVSLLVKSSSGDVRVPGNLSLRAGRSSASFRASTSDSSSQQSATVKVDLNGGEASSVVSILSNAGPSINVENPQVTSVGKALAFNVTAKDPNDLPVTLSASDVPAGANFNAQSGKFSWTPGEAHVGTHLVTFKARNSVDAMSEKVVTIDVIHGTMKIYGFTNAASSRGDSPCSPGSLATLWGVGFTDGSSQRAQSFPLPTKLNQVQVELNGVKARLLFVGARQVNLQCPFLRAGESLSIQLERTDTGETADWSAPGVAMQEASPAIFSLDGSGTGQGLVIVGSSSKVAMFPTADLDGQAAEPGDQLVIFANGLGLVDNEIAAGEPATASPLSQVVATVRVKVGDVFLPVSFAGLAPDLAGVYQVNAILSDAVPTGPEIPVSLEVTLPDGTVLESNIVTIAIQAGEPHFSE
jgi:uncharacterized protein (TIGR03437 family)